MNHDHAYLELINSFDEPYFEASLSGTITLSNSALNKRVGDFKGKNIHELFHIDQKKLILEVLSQVITIKQPQEIMLELQSAGEGARPVRLFLSPMFQPEQNALNALRGRIFGGNNADPALVGNSDKEEVADRQAEELAILNHLSIAISSSLNLDVILNSICKEMVNVFNARNTGIALLNKSQTKLEVVAFHTEHPEESDVTGLEFSLEGNDASLFVIKTGEPIVVPDAQFNPITRSLHEVMVRRGTTCLLLVPLLARGDVIGTIGIPSDSQTVFNQEDVRLAQTIAGQIASVIDNARLYRTVEKARDVAERELEIGRQIQTGFFPESLPQINGWQIYAHFQSARQVAGDFYDAFPVDQGRRIALVLADVCDKGVGAALFMVLFRSLLRENLQHCFNDDVKGYVTTDEAIVTAVKKTNNYIATTHAEASMFATVLVTVLEPDKNSVWYVNSGHDPPLVVRSNGHIERLYPTNPAIGIVPDLEISCKCIDLQSGDSLFAYTDGVVDASSLDGALFGEKRLLSIIADQSPLKKRLESLKTELDKHTKKADQYDDITCLGVNRSERSIGSTR